jgi:hypothetical protein
LIALAKSQPGKLTAGSNTWHHHHHRPVVQRSPARTSWASLQVRNRLVLDLLAGRIQAAFVGLADVDQHQGGKIRACSHFGYAFRPIRCARRRRLLPGFKVAESDCSWRRPGRPPRSSSASTARSTPSSRSRKRWTIFCPFGWTNSGGARTIPGLVEFMRRASAGTTSFKRVKFEPQ